MCVCVWADRYFLRKYIGRRHRWLGLQPRKLFKKRRIEARWRQLELRIRCFIVNSTDHALLEQSCLTVEILEEKRWKEGKASDPFRESDDRDSLSQRAISKSLLILNVL